MGADNVVARSPMAEVEERLGIRPIEELLHSRQVLIEELSPLRARYGPFGTWDHERKILLATLAMRARAISVRENMPKVTEASLSDMAHASPEYYDLVTTATLERSHLTLLETMVENIEHEIQRSNAIVRYLSAEARL